MGGILARRTSLADSVAVAFREQAPEEEHGEPVIVGPPLADLLPAIEDRPRDTGEGAADNRVREAGGAHLQRVVPGLPERTGVGALVQSVRRARGLADRAASFSDAGALG